AVPPKLHPHVAAIGPTQVRKRLSERRYARPRQGIVFVVRHQYADAPHPLGLLPPRHHRPRRCAREPRDYLATVHSITSSAVARSVSGMVRPSAFAVFRLMTRSNLVGCSTGISAGFVPRRILSTISAARRNRAGKFGP